LEDEAGLVANSRHRSDQKVAKMNEEPPAPKAKLKTFLAKAKQADDLAAQAANPEIQCNWQRIALGYRELARIVDKK
jgi:hypothetical protein